MKITRMCAVVLALVLAGGMTLVAEASDPGREPDHAPDYSNDFQYPAPPSSVGVRDTLLFEDFAGGVPPTGWAVVDNLGPSGCTWMTNGGYGEGNYTNGSGTCAMACSDCSSGAFDVELRTPVLDASAMENLVLDFTVNYANFANYDWFEVDVSANGGGSWTNVLAWNEDHYTSLFAPPGEDVSLDISAIADGQAQVMVRFHYYDTASGAWDWYVQVDNVRIWEYESRAGIPALTTGGIAVMLLALAGLAVMILRRRA